MRYWGARDLGEDAMQMVLVARHIAKTLNFC
jgi:hypothetical protein